MLFDHARVGMTQVLRHHEQRHAVHHGVACPRVPEPVETDRRLDPSVDARLRHRAELVRRPPGFAICLPQHGFAISRPDNFALILGGRLAIHDGINLSV